MNRVTLYCSALLGQNSRNIELLLGRIFWGLAFGFVSRGFFSLFSLYHVTAAASNPELPRENQFTV